MEQKRTWISGKKGYEIPCIRSLSGVEKKAVIVSHGFGSSKESPTASMLLEHLPEAGIGVFAFDFPAHGESPVDGEHLTVSDCLQSLFAAETELQAAVPEAEICYFGSSFGAYITLLYLSSGKGKGRKAFLRSAAVEMPLLLRQMTVSKHDILEKQGWFTFDCDYVRPLKLTQTFFDELERCDVFETYQKNMAELMMVHGSRDETASPQAARRFAEKAGAELVMLSGGDHRLSLEGMPETVLELARTFFLK